MGSVANVRIEPAKVTWGVDTAQVGTIQCVADVASSLNNKYFLVYTALNAIKYHVWFNVAAAGTDPAPGGSTALPVAISANASASTVATAVAAALDGLAGFVSTASGNIVTNTNASIGYSSASHDSASASATGFSFHLTTQGIAAADVGLIEGDSELKFDEELEDIKAQESGSNILGQLRKGFKASIKMTFKETSTAQLLKVLTQSGNSFIPVGSGATEVVGFGTAKQFESTFSQATKLVLHPVALPSTDHSRDWTFWLAYPKLESLKYSGEKQQEIPLTFTLFLDQSRKKGYEFGVFGDATQTLT